MGGEGDGAARGNCGLQRIKPRALPATGVRVWWEEPATFAAAILESLQSGTPGTSTKSRIATSSTSSVTRSLGTRLPSGTHPFVGASMRLPVELLALLAIVPVPVSPLPLNLRQLQGEEPPCEARVTKCGGGSINVPLTKCACECLLPSCSKGVSLAESPPDGARAESPNIPRHSLEGVATVPSASLLLKYYRLLRTVPR